MTSDTRWVQQLHLPADLSRKTFLDIGHDEESSVRQEAIMRGAERAIFLSADLLPTPDKLREALAGCRIDFALVHLELEPRLRPRQFLGLIGRHLAPGGTIVLDTALADSPHRRWSLTTAGGPTRWLPTQALFYDMLEDFAVRRISPTVWHLSPRLPTVTLIYGQMAAGKSNRLRHEEAGGSVTVSLDQALYALQRALEREREGEVEHPIQTAMREFAMEKSALPTANQIRFANYLAQRDLLDDFATLICQGVTDDFTSYAIEGGILSHAGVRRAVTAHLASMGCRVWDLHLGQPDKEDEVQRLSEEVDRLTETLRSLESEVEQHALLRKKRGWRQWLHSAVVPRL